MVIDNKIERYVRRVTAYLPIHDRARAGTEIFEMLRDLIRDYAGDHEPDILDARAVIDELGSPEELAATWLEQKKSVMKREAELREEQFASAAAHVTEQMRKRVGTGHPAFRFSASTAQKIMSVTMGICTILAFILVGIGLLGLGTHMIDTMFPIFLGCIMALIALTGRSFLIHVFE